MVPLAMAAKWHELSWASQHISQRVKFKTMVLSSGKQKTHTTKWDVEMGTVHKGIKTFVKAQKLWCHSGVGAAHTRMPFIQLQNRTKFFPI